MNELINSESPIVMEVTAYSGIAQKMNFLALGIKDSADAESSSVYIECYNKEIETDDGARDIKTIRLSTDLNVWTEIHPYDKFNGALLPKSVAVNLYDLYNIVKHCQDELISFWIDEESSELVINSYYQPVKDCDELEVRLKLRATGFPLRSMDISDDDVLNASISLSNLSTFNVIKQLNSENKASGVNLVIKDHKLRFESKYNGFDSVLYMKEHEEQVFIKDISVFIPFYAFNIMVSTGQVTDIKFDIYDTFIYVKTTDYTFKFPITEHVDTFDIDSTSGEDYLIIDAELAQITFDLINNLNAPSDISTLTIEKVSDGEADLTCTLDGRYSVSVRTDLAMLSDKVIEIDSDIFAETFKIANTDAIKLKLDDDGIVYIKIENGVMIRHIQYNHAVFNSFRKKSFETWKKD